MKAVTNLNQKMSIPIKMAICPHNKVLLDICSDSPSFEFCYTCDENEVNIITLAIIKIEIDEDMNVIVKPGYEVK